MKPILPVRVIEFCGCLIALAVGGFAWAQGYSHVRIVRLSFVEGTVTVQRPDVSDWSSAPVNTPIQEGFKLSTSQNSFAEVEFENTSTARLGELSLLEFTQLALSPSGDKINRITLEQGYATFSVTPQGDDVYEVKTPDATFTPYGKTLFRVDLDTGLIRVAVFKGAVEVSSPYGSGTIAKDNVLELHPGAEQAFQVSQGVTKDDWDAWVEQRENVESTLRNKQAPGFYSSDVNTLLYGWNDLWSYGNWSYLPGYGYGWSPFAPVGWAPYNYGRWCWYPGFGYTWIAAEPWGWLPFHYGDWVYVAGFGWSWLPGGFGAWSPGLVTWYQGPGWVGWAPRSGGGLPKAPGGAAGPAAARAGSNACPSPQACIVTMSQSAFQNGRSVNPGSMLAVDHSQGRVVESPDIPPTRLAMLPGFARPQGATPSGIAFDATSGRFVNSHASGTAAAASAVSAPSRAESGSAQTAVGANSEASLEGKRVEKQAPGQSLVRAAVTAKPAPSEPPVMGGRAASAGLSGNSGGRLSSGSSSSSGHSTPAFGGRFGGSSAASSSAPSSHGSASSSHGGGGFSGGGGGGAIGGGGGGGGGGGAASGGGHSGSSRH